MRGSTLQLERNSHRDTVPPASWRCSVSEVYSWTHSDWGYHCHMPRRNKLFICSLPLLHFRFVCRYYQSGTYRLFVFLSTNVAALDGYFSLSLALSLTSQVKLPALDSQPFNREIAGSNPAGRLVSAFNFFWGPCTIYLRSLPVHPTEGSKVLCGCYC